MGFCEAAWSSFYRDTYCVYNGVEGRQHDIAKVCRIISAWAKSSGTANHERSTSLSQVRRLCHTLHSWFSGRRHRGIASIRKNPQPQSNARKGMNIYCTCKLFTICCFYLLSQQVCLQKLEAFYYAFFSFRVTCQAVNILLMKPCEYFQRISPDVQFFPVEAIDLCLSCVILFDKKGMLFWTVVSSTWPKS